MTPKYAEEREECPRHKILLRKSKYKGIYCPKCASRETVQIRGAKRQW